MPKNRKEAIIFTCMMAFGMVLCMASYNALLKVGWNGPWVRNGLAGFIREYFVALPIAYFIGSPIAHALTVRFWPWKERLFPIGMGTFTPFVMAPIMTTVLHLFFFHVTDPAILGAAYFRNILGALFFQQIFVGPAVRTSFTKLMAR